jgi:glucose-1-phosphate thymidylyltransferase
LVYVLAKGVVVVPDSIRWTGPWLGATRTVALQRVANRPIICHVLDALRDAGVVEVAIVTPPDVAAEIAPCVESDGPPGIAVRHLVNDRPADCGDALLAAAEFVGDAPCILHRADGLLGQPILSMIQPADGRPRDAVLLVNNCPVETGRPRLVRLDQVADGDVDSPLPPLGIAGACALGPGVLRRLPNPGRSAQLLDFAAIAEQVAYDGGSTQVHVARRWRHFAGDALDLLEMNRAILDTLDAEATPSPGDGNRFEGNVSIHPTARVTSSIIIGPVMVGADALISDSYIGPYTSIAERVRIEGAELERSIVLAHASVLHVGGRLVASIVGRHARVFRDFSMPRALRLQVSDGDEVALC